jgi:hypothetical protein
MIGFLLTCSIKKEYLVASIMELIRKDVIRIGKLKEKKDYVLIHNRSSVVQLSKGEKYIIKWLFHDIGDELQVTFNRIKKEASKNCGYFSYCYHEWADIVNFEAAKYNFFESKKSFMNNMLLYFGISYILVLYNILLVNHYIIAIVIFILTTLFIIYTSTFYKRTREANREYEEWMAFKRYILKKDNIIHEYDEHTLCMYAIYSKVLKLDKEFISILRKRYKNDKELVNENMLLKAINMGIMQEIDKAISSGIKMSEFATILFAKNHGNQAIRRVACNDKVTLITELGE